jgi:hypothetical protein
VHEQRLGEARDADEQAVAVREGRAQQEVDDLSLPHDDLADRGQEPLPRGGQALEQRHVACTFPCPTCC